MEGEELSEMEWRSDEENCIPPALPENEDSESNEDGRNDVFQNTLVLIAYNGSQWGKN